MPKKSRADRLVDAQVAWVMDRFATDGFGTAIAADIDDLLAVGSRLTVSDVVSPESITSLLELFLARVPASTAISTVVEMAGELAFDGTSEPFTLADIIDRENVERLADEVLAGSDVVAAALDRMTASPLVATLASRFVGRVVNDAMATNRAFAEKIPGVGSLMSLGTKSAGLVMGAADRQFEQLFGETVTVKGAAFVMRRLNKIIVETLTDPTTKDALVEIFDLYADEPVPRLASLAKPEDIQRIAGLLQDIAIAGAPTEPIQAIAGALIDGFFRTYGNESVTAFLTDLDLDRDALLAQATTFAGRALTAARESGELERLLRSRLAEFYASPEVAAILAD